MREIDRLARAAGENRSSMINQILADCVSYVTPEERSRLILSEVRRLMLPSGVFQFPSCLSGSMLRLRTTLSYKYNPTVRYDVELKHEPLPAVGTLRVRLRTQNAALIGTMEAFYLIWTRLETAELGERDCSIDGEKYSRVLSVRTPDGSGEFAVGSGELGGLIARYIITFDAALKLYFHHLREGGEFPADLLSLYRRFESGGRLLL